MKKVLVASQPARPVADSRLLAPGNVYRGTLPEKPRLIAHRGASTLAPENTLASMQTAADLGVYGLETDITVSADGVLFLMHDNTLVRTTDVAQGFSRAGRRPRLRPSPGTSCPIWMRGAGSMGGLIFSGEPIPTLEAILQVVKENDLYFIYDLRIPAAGHPYTGQALDLCLQEIKAAGVADHTWVLAEPDAIAQIRSILPDAILAAGIGYTDIPPSPASLVANGYRVVNSVYGLSNRRIHGLPECRFVGQPVGGGRTLAIFTPLAGRRRLGHLQAIPRACWPCRVRSWPCPTASTCRYGASLG